MHRAKAFFYICAGLFLLALGYHLGANTASAQSSLLRTTPLATVFVGSRAFVLSADNHGWVEVTNQLPPVDPSTLLEFSAANNTAVTNAGEGWYNYPATGWTSLGFVPGGGTPTTQKSWGQVKVDHR